MKLVDYYIQYDFEGNPIHACGFVYGNPKFIDGTYIITSNIVELDLYNKKVITKNSTYDLER